MDDLWQPIRFDADLVQKYDRPGPRYTSYPTVPHFRDGFGAAEHSALLAASAAGEGYSTCAETDLLAFGVSSISAAGGGYAQNVKAIPDYRAAVEARGLATCRGLALDREDLLRRDVIRRLMCHFRLEKGEVEAAHGIDFDRHFAAELAALLPLADDGLLELTARRLEVTPPGRLLVRNLAMAFDAYLRTGATVRYSRTV
jgi:oxygen-independent coproporphyrinogen III oxidase